MSFSYGAGSNPQIDYPRLLIGDTISLNHIFEDSEILSAYAIQAMLASNLSSPVSVLRVAALLLDSIASSKARLAVSKLLDANITPAQTARALHEQAAAWRAIDDDSGAFVVIEQCTTGWGFLQRFNSQIQRQTA